MGQRHIDAVAIQEGGACNMSGIARALVKACDEARSDGAQPGADAAVSLILHQMVFLCPAVKEYDAGMAIYDGDMALCRKHAQNTAKSEAGA